MAETVRALENASRDSANYTTYLHRMRESIKHSSKQILLSFAITHHRILDVGCGDGSMIYFINEKQKELFREDQLDGGYFLGIDLNPKSIVLCPNLTNADFEQKSLSEVAEEVEKGYREPFDCVLFGSVLHEFSSYDKSNPYTLTPIRQALQDAYKCLRDDGTMIIRDGLKSTCKSEFTIEFRDPSDIHFVTDFISESPIERVLDYPVNVHYNSHSCTAPWSWLQEFLRTYTWGQESWSREVKEINGIATEEEWRKMIEDAGFRMIVSWQFEDGYPDHLSDRIYLKGEKDKAFSLLLRLLMKDMNEILVARKGKENNSNTKITNEER